MESQNGVASGWTHDRARSAGLAELPDLASRYQTFVEHLPLATYVEELGEESAGYISNQIFDLVGYTAAEWVADESFFGRVLHPDDRERVLELFAKMHASGEPVETEYRLIASDGSTVWIHDAAVVIVDDEGRPKYAQGYMIDVTQRKRHEASLRDRETQLRKHVKRIEHQALHDSLTDLPNRTLFTDRTGQALRQGMRDGTGFAVMLLDLDRFKEVNDTLGHQSGDKLLVEVARRLHGALRGVDTVARFGGDEFAILAPGLGTPDSAYGLAERVRQEISKPMVLGGLELELEASIGIALFPADGIDVETLVRRADVSMYVSKNTHTPVLYSEEYDQSSLARLALVTELRKAIDGGELTIDYQPQIDAETGSVRKVEALVRWKHPKHGLLMPDQFIPFAEQTGLIRSVTTYVLTAAVGTCASWQADGSDVTVAVNVTGRDLVDLDFPDEVAALLAKAGVHPSRLELEITERTIMSDPMRACAVLKRLSESGIRIAIDDFGSGHASLAYLRGLPISVLKIDKSFVLGMIADREDDALVRAAIDLGHNLGLEVVAEGVETAEATDRLRALGCDTLQGYHLGRPQAPPASWRAPGGPELDAHQSVGL
ncbi:MAG TPA: EAL domain-containing protein [Gaiellaceae bacterium]|jgi:diguanylate cyclase (GGDEF)-like protein/PAS domain S-box-containing protein